MAGFQSDDDVERLVGCLDDDDAARALHVPVERIRRAEVQLLFERCSVAEAISAIATCAATGDAEGARSILDAIVAATSVFHVAGPFGAREPILA